MVSVLVLSRYASVRIGLRAMLEGRDGIAANDEASGRGDLESVAVPDVVVYDFEDEGSEGILSAIAQMQAGVVVLGAGAELAQCLAGLPLRGWALLSRDASAEEVAAAVHAVAGGLIALGGSSTALLRFPLPVLTSGADVEASGLTAREREILQLMADGLPNKQIATGLGISLHTVKFHVAATLAKLGVASRTEAVTVGIRQGFVHL